MYPFVVKQRLLMLELMAERDGEAQYDKLLRVFHRQGRRARYSSGRFSESYKIYEHRLLNGMWEIISREEALALLNEMR